MARRGIATAHLTYNLQGLRKKYIEVFNSGVVDEEIGDIVVEALKPFVPQKTGTLADSGKIKSIDNSDSKYHEILIAYDTKGQQGNAFFPPTMSGGYAHYIYEGEVYGPNIPIFAKGDSKKKGGTPIAFFSRPGMPKYPTGQIMKHPAPNSPGATDHWDQALMQDGAARGEMNRQIRKAIRDAWNSTN